MHDTEKKLWSFYTTDEAPLLRGSMIALHGDEGDLSALPAEREAFRERLGKSVEASVLYRFAHEIHTGDYVLLRTEHGRPVDVGEVVGDYAFASGALPHQRAVRWIRRLEYKEISTGAMRELSYASAAPIFHVRRYAAELLAAAGVDLGVAFGEPRLREFAAGLLQGMGYHVTQLAAGGADFFARRDELSPRVPVIVREDEVTLADVAALLKAGDGGFGLLFTLERFSPEVREALAAARVRGVDGAELRALTRKYYTSLQERVRKLNPFRSVA